MKSLKTALGIGLCVVAAPAFAVLAEVPESAPADDRAEQEPKLEHVYVDRPTLSLEGVRIEIPIAWEAEVKVARSRALAEVYRHVKKDTPVIERKLQLSVFISERSDSEKCRELILIADGRAIKPMDSVWQRKPGVTAIIGPSVSAHFLLADLDRLGRAFDIRGRVCKDEFTFANGAPGWFAELAKEARKPPVMEKQ